MLHLARVTPGTRDQPPSILYAVKTIAIAEKLSLSAVGSVTMSLPINKLADRSESLVRVTESHRVIPLAISKASKAANNGTGGETSYVEAMLNLLADIAGATQDKFDDSRKDLYQAVKKLELSRMESAEMMLRENCLQPIALPLHRPLDEVFGHSRWLSRRSYLQHAFQVPRSSVCSSGRLLDFQETIG